MFWGLVVQPNKKYTSRVKKAFHVSQAVLDTGTTLTEKAVKLILQRAGEPEYILCVLKKSGQIQVSLNLNFAKDDEITFVSVGGTIHLSGYTENDLLDDISEEDGEDSDSDKGDEEDDSSDVDDKETDEAWESDEEKDGVDDRDNQGLKGVPNKNSKKTKRHTAKF